MRSLATLRWHPPTLLGRNSFIAGRRRNLAATSAEKRKWRREGVRTKRERLFQQIPTLEPSIGATKASAKRAPSHGGNPFLFLVVFPVAMTGVVVMLRDDLRQELAEMGRKVGRSSDNKTH